MGLVLLLVTHQAVVELRRYGRQLRGPNRDRTKLSHSQGLLGECGPRRLGSILQCQREPALE